jgi:hypothetical protein
MGPGEGDHRIDEVEILEGREEIVEARPLHQVGIEGATEALIEEEDTFGDAHAGLLMVHSLRELEGSGLLCEGETPGLPVQRHRVDQGPVAVENEASKRPIRER